MLQASNSDFVWGVATASYQIEGAYNVDGRGRGTWDVFSERPGAIFQGHTARQACDHYHRLDEDLDLLAGLGVDAYRFGVSWPRVLPGGTGQANDSGLAFYDRLIDGLLARGITPYLTLFHWDYPHSLEQQGGFRSTKSPGWFEEYTELLARRYGDRVRHWFTLNEPHAFIEGGLRHGRHAPGHRLPLSEVLRAGHHALLAHGRATQVLRSLVPQSWVAMAPVLICATPKTESESDIEAARAWTFGMYDSNLRVSSWWMDPALGRGYPSDGLSLLGTELGPIPAQELELIAQPLDAVGFNLYDSAVVRAGPQGEPIVCPPEPGSPRTAFDWPMTPQGHYWGPLFAHQRYKLPTMVTENGLSNRDWVDRNGAVNDPARVDFIDRHVSALLSAREQAQVQGYFHWSLLDNFEWNHGYRERFGLVHVDYQTMKRTPKQSYHYYRKRIDRERQAPGA